ncbi:MAG: hypothetical protein ABI595_09155 [Actinomycetota bacterium]
MRRAVLVLLAAAAMSLGVMQAASAVGGSVTIKFNHDTENFHGKVRSTESECRINRMVRVFLVTADGRELQGRTRANDEGVWRVHLMEAHGNYIAIASKYEAMHATCDRLASDILDVM